MRFSAPLIVLMLLSGLVSDSSLSEPPANEGQCDQLIGGTPGLYGLCVAFSQSQYCEPDFGLDDPFEGCKPSARKLLALYNNKSRPGDPIMPGVKDPCACFTLEELQTVFPIVERCRDFSAAVDPERDQEGIELFRSDPLGVAQALQLNWSEDRLKRCLFIDRSVTPNVFRNQEVTDLGLQLCDAEIRSYALSLGLECEAFR